MRKTEVTRQEILADDPIYTEYNLESREEDEIVKLFTSGSIDSYCPNCGRQSVFKIESPFPAYSDAKDRNLSNYGLLTVHAKCTRTEENNISDKCGQDLHIVFKRGDKFFDKIGQYPSRASLEFGDLDAAFRELDESSRKELGTSIGLYAHGVGIGSFVYLRRIFETLVENAHIEAKGGEDDWDEEAYLKLRMTEKIKTLKGYLPSRLTKSADLYGILSQGIHELSEEECVEKHPMVKQAIQLILRQQHEDKEYEGVVGKMQRSKGT